MILDTASKQAHIISAHHTRILQRSMYDLDKYKYVYLLRALNDSGRRTAAAVLVGTELAVLNIWSHE